MPPSPRSRSRRRRSKPRKRISPARCWSTIARRTCSTRARCPASASMRAETAHRAGVAQRDLATANLAQANAALRRSREVQSNATVTSPVNGFVVERNYDSGVDPRRQADRRRRRSARDEARSRRVGARGRPAARRHEGGGVRCRPSRARPSPASSPRSRRKSTSAIVTSRSTCACRTTAARCCPACMPPPASPKRRRRTSS